MIQYVAEGHLCDEPRSVIDVVYHGGTVDDVVHPIRDERLKGCGEIVHVCEEGGQNG